MSHRVLYGPSGQGSVEILPDEELTDEAHFALQIILSALNRTDGINIDRIVGEAYALAHATFAEGRRRHCINPLPRVDSLGDPPVEPVLSEEHVFPSWRQQAEAEEMPLRPWITKVLNTHCNRKRLAAAKRTAAQTQGRGANVVCIDQKGK